MEKEENVIFTQNCTAAINMVLKGVLKSGDHVVVSDLEHNAVMRPLEKLAERGVTYSRAEVFPGDNDRTVDSFRHAIGRQTRLIACTHCSNVWGIRLPIERLCALAHEYGILFLLDAAQSAGVVPVDIADSKVDFLCCAGHKGLYGPMGIGVLLVRDTVPDSLIEGGTGSNSISLQQPEELPDKLESGTPNLTGIMGMRAGMDFVMGRKIENIADHEFRLIGRLYDELRTVRNVRLYLPRPEPEHFAPLLSFNIDGHDSEEIARLLNRNHIAVRAGLHCAPSAHEKMGTLEGGAVRISPSYFTSMSDMMTTAYVVRRLAAR